MNREATIGDELRLATRSYLKGHDSAVEDHLRRALAIYEGKRRGLA